jgi:hypothetical protein
MANIRVTRKLTKIINLLAQVNKVAPAGDSERAEIVDRYCTDIAETAARLAGWAREQRGYRKGSAKQLTKAVRKALGYTYP